MKSIANRDYATALLESLEAEQPSEKLINNFLTVVRQNGDWARRSAIAAEFETLWRAKYHHDKMLVESARPLSAKQREELRKKLHSSQSGNLDLEERLNPELIAGVRLTLNDEMQLDTSLTHLLKKIFPKK